jgi:oxygen-dependent protoporphyrinogen oxidase
MKSRTADIVIAGAGLTGLTLAYSLHKSGKKVIVIEKENRPGGVINTISELGFTFETGPNTGVLSTPELAALFDELKDHCQLEKANQGAKTRYILKKGKLEPLPSGLVSAITTPLFTLKDKFRILGEPFRKKGDDPDESLEQMVLRRLGRSFLDYAVDPFISGIYAGDPATLVTRFALPKLYALEQNYGSFIKGAIKKAKEPKSEAQLKATGEVFSVRGGLVKLISSLAGEIGEERLLTGINGTSIKLHTKGYLVTFTGSNGDQEEILTDSVITTFGGSGLQKMLPFIPEAAMKPIMSLKYAGVVQVAAGYNLWRGSPLDAFGGLIPSKEKRDTLGILFPSAIFEGRAPLKGALLSAFLGGVKKPEIINKSDDEIISIVLKEIAGTLNEHSQPDLIRIFRYQQAIPQYGKSTGERLDCIQSIQKQYPGLILAGNIRDGIGMADRVKQALNIKAELSGGNNEK